MKTPDSQKYFAKVFGSMAIIATFAPRYGGKDL